MRLILMTLVGFIRRTHDAEDPHDCVIDGVAGTQDSVTRNEVCYSPYIIYLKMRDAPDRICPKTIN